uniref:PX domain-containing protein n=1 Tax=Periophthalmus magnuspinnatus TaxID=409849 RepID=A0A3B4AE76_9GOBI
RINALIEEEVQRRLRQINLNTDNDLSSSLQVCVSSLSPGGWGLDPSLVSVPRFVLRGQGKDEHFEFEVKLSLRDDTWSVFRRYSRFREMHHNLRLRFPQVACLDFPPKKLFRNKDEKMVSERRLQLQRYLRDLFALVQSWSPSPLRPDSEPLNKHHVYEFSSFFKKGVFESSSHGTG